MSGPQTETQGKSGQASDLATFNEARYGQANLTTEQVDRDPRIQFVLDLARQSKAKRVLDVGCVDGFLAKDFKAMGMYVIGVDGSPSAVEVAKSRCDEAYVADLGRQPLPIPDASVDLIWAGEIIEHIFDTETFLEDLLRVAAPGALLILSTPNLASWINRISIVLGAQPFFTEVGVRPSNDGSFLRKVTEPAGHIRNFTASSLKHLLQSCGWRVDSIRGACILVGKGRTIDRALGRIAPSLATDLVAVCRK